MPAATLFARAVAGGTIAATIILSAGAALAQPSRADAMRVVTAISSELGVSPWSFASCAKALRSDPQVAAATGPARADARKAALLPCLQKANPAITAEMLDAAIARHKPLADG